MTTAYEIPFSSPPETFSITIAGIEYQLTATWCDPAQCWTLAIADSSGNPILSSIPIVTGADLLEQYDYLNLGFQLIVQTDSDPNAVPTFTNLGTTGHVYAVLP